MLEADQFRLGLYVHWPFCEKRCPYCDFNSHAADTPPEGDYVTALLADLDDEAAVMLEPAAGGVHTAFKARIEPGDTVWAVEHHFLEEYSHCSAPELFLTAAAMQTQRIRVGHGAVVCVPEMNHPIRVAERAAVLDLLSDGRLEFGTPTDTLPPGVFFGVQAVAVQPGINALGAVTTDTEVILRQAGRVLGRVWAESTSATTGVRQPPFGLVLQIRE